MTSKPVVVGLISGLAVVVLTLLLVGIVNLPEAEGAVSTARRACHREQVAQDQGYGIARQVVRTVCDTSRSD